MSYAIFDEEGNCKSVFSGVVPREAHYHVPEGASPEDVWLDVINKRVFRRPECEDGLKKTYNVGEMVQLPKLDKTKLYIDGMLFEGEAFTKHQPGTVHIFSRGKCRLSKYIEFVSYAELRQMEYPSVVQQLDMIYHHGVEGWKKEIDKIKNKYPKPQGNKPTQ